MIRHEIIVASGGRLLGSLKTMHGRKRDRAIASHLATAKFVPDQVAARHLFKHWTASVAGENS